MNKLHSKSVKQGLLKTLAHSKNIILLSLITISFSFGDKFSSLSMLDKDGAEYDLSQKMSINMKDSDIKNVLMLIGELTNLNIVVSPSVKDTITANLENVSVKAALDVILKPNGYSYFTQENIVIVKGADNEVIRELETVIIKLKYISSNDLNAPLQTVLSDQGKIQPFTPVITTSGSSGLSNVVVISDFQERIPNIRKMIEELDRPIANVNIAVRFIESGVDSAKGSGIDWSQNTPIFLGGATDTTGSLVPFKLNNATVATLNPLQFGKAWKLMQARGESKILASPQITTLDNHSANTKITTTIYIEGSVSNMSNSYSNTNFGNTSTAGINQSTGFSNMNTNQITEKDVGIDLSVTPRINDENRITLTVNASVEALLAAAEVGSDKPRSTKRTVQTQVTVNAGDTVIIGGLIAENAIENRKFVPVLSELPWIGRMFRSTSIDKEQRELLIFITPNVVG